MSCLDWCLCFYRRFSFHRHWRINIFGLFRRRHDHFVIIDIVIKIQLSLSFCGRRRLWGTCGSRTNRTTCSLNSCRPSRSPNLLEMLPIQLFWIIKLWKVKSERAIKLDKRPAYLQPSGENSIPCTVARCLDTSSHFGIWLIFKSLIMDRRSLCSLSIVHAGMTNLISWKLRVLPTSLKYPVRAKCDIEENDIYSPKNDSPTEPLRLRQLRPRPITRESAAQRQVKQIGCSEIFVWTDLCERGERPDGRVLDSML